MSKPIPTTGTAIVSATDARQVRRLAAPLVLGTLLLLAGSAHAGPTSERHTYSAASDGQRSPREDADDVRLRGGFSLNGGLLFLPNTDNAYGGVIGLGLRLGVQFTDRIVVGGLGPKGAVREKPEVLEDARRIGRGLAQTE